MTDTQELNRVIDESGYKRSWLAEQLGLSPYGLAKKINNETEFKVSEVEKLSVLLGIKTYKRQRAIFFAGNVD